MVKENYFPSTQYWLFCVSISAEIFGVPKPQFKVLNDTFSLCYYSNMLPSCVRVKCWQKLLSLLQLFHNYSHFLFHSAETMKSSFSYLTGFLYHKCFYSHFCIIHKNRAQWFELFHHATICSFTRANGHITLKAPVLVRSPQLSNVESGQYLDGWPPGNTRCCWLFVTRYFSDNNSVFWHFFSSYYSYFFLLQFLHTFQNVRKNQHLGGKLNMILPLSLANVKHIIKFVITMHIITNLYVII